MAKLNQILAIAKGIKSANYAAATKLYQLLGKPELFNGFSKTYRKKNEESDDKPAESQRVQLTVSGVLANLVQLMGEQWNIEARRDWTNCVAASDVVLDGKVLIKSAPVTFLLMMEKQLTDVVNIIGSLPTLDPARAWDFDAEQGLSRAAMTQTISMKKVKRAIVLYDATDRHPAQTQLIDDDEVVGTWDYQPLSGAISPQRKKLLQERAKALLEAVKMAREGANVIEEVSTPDVGNAVFGYLMAS